MTNPGKAEGYLETLQRETDRLAYVIESLLDLSQIQHGEVELSLSRIDLNELVSAFVADRPLLARSKGLTLRVEQEAGLPPVRADKELLGQVLSALLTNAISYTPIGGHVVVSTQKREVDEKEWIGFIVSDTGPGIPLGEQAHVMERFFRGKVGRESRVAGTGLGLAIAKEIVEMHRGWIEVESEGIQGKGSTFSVWLPLED